MKKSLLSGILLAFASMAQAQLFVKDGSYMFVNNQYVYVTSDVDLNNSGNMYLRNSSQLLQGTAGAGANKGTGKLSVYQEGTVNNFHYNYWCSPVGVPALAAGNNTFGITALNRPTALTSSTPIEVLPINNYNGTATGGAGGTMQIAPYWIWKFVTSNAYAQWVQVASASTLNAGEGFTMKGTSGTDALIADVNDGVQNKSGVAQRYDFRGKPNDGTISVAVSNGNFTLTGNPYPSAIDIHNFLTDNAAVIDGTIYYWEQALTNSHLIAAYQGGYGKYTIAAGYVPSDVWSYDGAGNYVSDTGANGASGIHNRFVPIGQGFMVKGTAAGSIQLRNTHRIYKKETDVGATGLAKNAVASNSDYYEEIPNVAGIDYTKVRKGHSPQIRVNAQVNNGGKIHTVLGFGDQFTKGFDYSADAMSTNVDRPHNFYHILEGSDKEYCASIDKFDIDRTYPIGFRCTENTSYKVKVDDVLWGFDSNQMVYIHDKQTGIYYDIKNNAFEMSFTPGNYNNRFEITFKNFANQENNNLAEQDFDVFQNQTNSMLTIVNTSKKDVASCTIFDVAGKLVYTKLNLGKNDLIEIPTSSISEGVYIVKVTTKDNSSIDKKVIISKK